MTQKERLQELSDLVLVLDRDVARLEWIAEKVLNQYGSAAWMRYSEEWDSNDH